MSEDWLYQIRIRVSKKLSEAIRMDKSNGTATKLTDIASRHRTKLVCTYDAFATYCAEAEKNGIGNYPLYDWTKQTIETPEKKCKHLKSFAFYKGDQQIYEKSLAEALYQDLRGLLDDNTIEDLTIIDSNPANNPQPPNS